MSDNAQIILAIGVLLLIGMAAHLIGKRTFLPRVSLLVICGIAIGPAGMDLIPPILVSNFDLIATMALLMIGFLLGGKLTSKSFRRSHSQSVVISLSAAIGTAVLVFAGLMLIGVPTEIALLLGCIASATAPAATVDIVNESGSRSAFAELLLLVVALDDIWGLILFSFALAAIGVMQGIDSSASPLLIAAQDIGGGALIGLTIGLPAAYLTGRIKPGKPILTEALGLAFVCGGLALWMGSSFLIASMVMGATIANLARHHKHPFHAIEDIEAPFLIVFFVLAGASLELDALAAAGVLGIAYMVSRVIGKIAGAAAGAGISHADPQTTRWMGLALMPQAGVAVGMALVASSAFPEYRSVLLPIVIGATVVFEILGPIGTRMALNATKNKADD
jgi:Kef-type K+ transport system membrane component KefB